MAILTEPPSQWPLPARHCLDKPSKLRHLTQLAQALSDFYLRTPLDTLAVMAPKTADKKPAPAKKAVAKKSTGGRKKGSKKAVESYKIYIYKVC